MKKVLLIALISLSFCHAAQYSPTSAYTAKTIQGWNILVNNELLTKDADLSQKVLKQLDHQLYQVTRVLPAGPLNHLRKVTIWVEYDAPKHDCACYHPNRQWLIENDFNPEKAGGIEIADAKNFLSWTIPQPWMVLHELAHAYHHQVLGYDNAEIKEAYQKAVESKKYESVLHINGRSERAYALNNDQEYFAECSEAFLGTNDFFPFVRSELQQHDKKMYELLKKLWKK
jgi:hypothetical protein